MPRHTVHAKDVNHDPLFALARQLFPVVEDHHNYSLGYDGIWANGRDVWVVEIKPPGKYKLTDSEKKAQARWGSRYRVVQDEATVHELAMIKVTLPNAVIGGSFPGMEFRPADLSPMGKKRCVKCLGTGRNAARGTPCKYCCWWPSESPPPGYVDPDQAAQDERRRRGAVLADDTPLGSKEDLSPLARRLKRRGAP